LSNYFDLLLKLSLYLVAFLTYSALNSGMTLKSGASIALSCTVFELFDVEIWVRGHSRSFKLVPFESLGAVFHLPSKTKGDIGQKL